MLIRFRPLIVGGLLFICAAAMPAQKPSTEDILRKLDAEWAHTKSVDGCLSFYAGNVIVLPPNATIAYGKEQARKSVADLLGLPGL